MRTASSGNDSSPQASAAHPVALTVWRRRERERLNLWLGQYTEETAISDLDYHAFLNDGRPLFCFMYEQLSPTQREGETTRLATAIAANPFDSQASSDAYVWRHQAYACNSERRRSRREVETDAIEAAKRALAHCTYLGGHQRFTARPQPCAATISIGPHGSLSFNSRREKRICSIRWTEIHALQVVPVNETQRRPSRIPRWRSASLIGKRREAAIKISTPDGDAVFIVHGRHPDALRRELTPLIDCVAQLSAEDYEDANTQIRVDLPAVEAPYRLDRA